MSIRQPGIALVGVVSILVAGLTATAPAAAGGPALRWSFHDSAAAPGAFCTYDGGEPRRRVFVPVHMPLIYWPDQHPGRVDRGKVGWQIILQVRFSATGPWRTAYVSSITTGRASDTRPADVAKLAINWRVPGRVAYRVENRAIWFRPDGSRLGTRTALVQWYELARALAPWHEGSPGGWEIGNRLGLRHGSCPNLLSR